jgi:hypothetical protein
MRGEGCQLVFCTVPIQYLSLREAKAALVLLMVRDAFHGVGKALSVDASTRS